MVISYPVNLFSLDLRAKKHLMIAGGIGITPFVAQTAQLAARRRQFRAALCLPHRLVCPAYGGACSGALRRAQSILYHDDRGQKIELDRLLSSAAARHASLCLRPRAG